ncbi:MAG: hypothetical protein HYX41_05485 [Bdellovibrio sp.]|nr:hypothetical protein [Bdellovibrio sp.]
MGFFINYALGPLYLKNILPHSTAEDPDLLARLYANFDKMRLKPPLFLIINLEQFKVTTLTWVGFHSAKGPFRPVLAISKWMLKALPPEELEALVLNQVARVYLAHSRRRIFLTLFLIGATSVAALGSVFFFQKIIPGPMAIDLIGPGVALLSFILSFRVIASQTKRHEFEADVFTISSLGVPLDKFAEALILVDQHTQAAPQMLNSIHPDTQLRIDELRSHFLNHSEKEIDSSDRDSNRPAA